MPPWIRDNREAFERDLLQDFCLASRYFDEQFKRFARTRTLSFPVFRDLVGEPTNKGLLWRLKDTAHHLFRIHDFSPVGLLLDWTLGYIFHESVKLMEDAHQRQYYVPQLAGFVGQETPPQVAALLEDLLAIQSQTSESMEREVNRLKNLFRHSCHLFCAYFAGACEHRPLARFLYGRNELVRSVFREQYDDLIASVYGKEPERMPLEAAWSLLENARLENAAQAVESALSINPENASALELREKINAVCSQTF